MSLYVADGWPSIDPLAAAKVQRDQAFWGQLQRHWCQLRGMHWFSPDGEAQTQDPAGLLKRINLSHAFYLSDELFDISL